MNIVYSSHGFCYPQNKGMKIWDELSNCVQCWKVKGHNDTLYTRRKDCMTHTELEKVQKCRFYYVNYVLLFTFINFLTIGNNLPFLTFSASNQTFESIITTLKFKFKLKSIQAHHSNGFSQRNCIFFGWLAALRSSISISIKTSLHSFCKQNSTI